MTIFFHVRHCAGWSRARRSRAFTLVEMMVTMTIFTFVIMALIYSHIFGLRYDQIIGSKLGASDQSRLAFGKMAREIRAAKNYQIGTGTLAAFTPDENGTNQIGDALKLYPTTNAATYVVYYTDSSSQELRRRTNTTDYAVAAQYLTNYNNVKIFQSEDYLGNVQTTNNYKYLIHVTVQFWQYKYPKTTVGPGSFYDYYKMEYKAVPRAQ